MIADAYDIPGIRKIDELIQNATANGNRSMSEFQYTDVNLWDSMVDELRALRQTIIAAHVVNELEKMP